MGKISLSKPLDNKSTIKMKNIFFLLTLCGLSFAKSLLVEEKIISTNFSSEVKASSQQLVCYDLNNGGGQSYRFTDYAPNLGSYNWDNKITSCCFTGLWILYAEQNYNRASTGSSNWWAYGDYSCLDTPTPFDNVASSLRYAGKLSDWKSNTLTLYFNDYFIGDEEYMNNDVTHLSYPDKAKSLIVTGCLPWTVYADVNYRGKAMCVWPSDPIQCTPGLYPARSTLGSLADNISSVKRGCNAKENVFPVNYLKQESGSASGYFPFH